MYIENRSRSECMCFVQSPIPARDRNCAQSARKPRGMRVVLIIIGDSSEQCVMFAKHLIHSSLIAILVHDCRRDVSEVVAARQGTLRSREQRRRVKRSSRVDQITRDNVAWERIANV